MRDAECLLGRWEADSSGGATENHLQGSGARGSFKALCLLMYDAALSEQRAFDHVQGVTGYEVASVRPCTPVRVIIRVRFSPFSPLNQSLS